MNLFFAWMPSSLSISPHLRCRPCLSLPWHPSRLLLPSSPVGRRSPQQRRCVILQHTQAGVCTHTHTHMHTNPNLAISEVIVAENWVEAPIGWVVTWTEPGRQTTHHISHRRWDHQCSENNTYPQTKQTNDSSSRPARTRSQKTDQTGMLPTSFFHDSTVSCIRHHSRQETRTLDKRQLWILKSWVLTN